MTSPTVHCYAARRINPIQGVVQIVSIAGARALSHDGQLWEIQVLSDIPDHTWGSSNAGTAGRQFFRFGSWHAERGLRQVPANPLLDLGAMQVASARLITSLQAHLGDLPFVQEDRYECWLFDLNDQPLALVASATDERLIERIQPEDWRAATPAGHDHLSEMLQANGNALHDGQELERLVRETAVASRWYCREPGGSRSACHDDIPHQDDMDFPPLGLREQWPEPWQETLVHDYLNWCAPALLTWDHLDADRRAALERAAWRNAAAVARSWPLYPTVIDQQALTRTRVEARLRDSKKND